MPPKKNLSTSVTQNVSGDRNISIEGDVVDSVVIAGDNNTVNQNFTQKIINIFKGDTEQQRAMRNRRAMLELVKNTWIKGVLEKSLYNEVLIALGMEERPSTVDHPWDMQLQMPNQANRTLPANTSMIDIFDEMNSAMLILGEPGSGKTTMLLELARDAITRAEQDATQPIPTVLNLSSWTNPRQPISTWLVQELSAKYFVSKKLAQLWIDNDELLLLLDGLDEVVVEYRDLCVKAINDFRMGYGSMQLAVCSRIEDYDALITRLQLQSAVLIQPLTIQQIDEYFERVGPELADVRQVLQHDTMLQELVQQPLILSVLTLAYRGASAEELLSEKLNMVDNWRKHLFDTYVQQMFERVARSKNKRYSLAQTKHWLAWLAQIMIRRSQSSFLLEHIDLLLHQRIQKKLRVIVAVSFWGFIGWILDGFSYDSRPVFAIIFSFIALVTVVARILFFSEYETMQNSRLSNNSEERLTWSWKKSIIGLAVGLCLGLIFLFIRGTSGSAWGFEAFEFSIVFGAILGIMSGLTLKYSPSLQQQERLDTINSSLYSTIYKEGGRISWRQMNARRNENQLGRSSELLQWSWKRALTGAGLGLALGLIDGIIILLLVWAFALLTPQNFELILSAIQDIPDVAIVAIGIRLLFSLWAWLCVLLVIFGSLAYGLHRVDIEAKTALSQGAHQSLRNALAAFLSVELTFGIGAELVKRLLTLLIHFFNINRLVSSVLLIPIPDLSTSIPGWMAGLIVGIIFAIIWGLYYGGYAVLYHYILRLILYSSGHLPWNYVRFLDYAAERIFLRRVGGGYIFVHRLLMEHFAAMYREDRK